MISVRAFLSAAYKPREKIMTRIIYLFITDIINYCKLIINKLKNS